MRIESTNDPEVVRQQFAAAGLPPIAINDGDSGSQTATLVEEDPSGKSAEEVEDKTALESETGEKATQETPSQGETTKPKGETQTRSADKKIGKLTAQLETAREELDRKNGNESKFREQIEELEAKLAELEPKQIETPKLVRPKRPEPPDLADPDINYDATKFQSEMKKYRTGLEKYETDLEEYQDKKTALAAQETVTAYQEAREKAERETAAAKAADIFVKKYAAETKEIDGWDDFWADQPENNPDFSYGEAVDAAIKSADNPAKVVWYLANNLDELKRINSLNPVGQIAAIGRLDATVAKEPKAATEPTKSEKQPEKKMTLQPEKKTTPAQPQRTRTPDAPITPVGGSATTAPPNSDAAYAIYIANNDTKGFVEEFNRRRVERIRKQYGR